MLDSRKIEDLHRVLQDTFKKHEAACAKHGVKIILTSTKRDQEYQSKLFAQGRTAPGKICTNARLIGPHGFGLAYDVVPVVNGKAVWNDNKLWKIIGEEGKRLGLEWGGDWKSIDDKPHFQYTGGLTSAQLRAGAHPSWWNEKTIGRKSTVIGNNVNVRKEPDQKAVAEKIQLMKNAAVMVFESKDGWYRIGSGRWVYSLYVRID